MPFYKKIAWMIFFFSIVSLLFIIAFQDSNVSTLPVGWDKSYPITPYDLYVKNIKMAQRGNIIAVVYEGEKNKAIDVYVSLSFDEGKKFIQPVKIALTPSKTERYPDISVSSKGHIAVTWQELSGEDPNNHIYYSISADMGATWSEPIRFKTKTEMELLPKVLYDDKGRLHIFYSAYRDKGFNLFHTISEDEKIFSEPDSLVEISAALRGAFFPAIHASGRQIYLVWQGKEKMTDALSDDLYFIKSNNYGSSWSSKKLITKSKAKDSSPYITSFENDLYLAYQNDETKNWAIKMMKATDRGDRWEEPVTVSTTNADCYSPSIVVSDDESLFVVWYDARNKIPGIFAKKIVPRSRVQLPEIMLSRTEVAAKKPIAFSAGKKLMVLWEEAGRLVVKNSDVYVEPPVVYSQTHPENVWSKASRAVIKWKPPVDESNITGYATFLKRAEDYNLPDIDPTISNIEGNVTEYRTPDLEDGISFFYIRAIDGAGNYSRTVRYKIQVSKNPPDMPIVKSPTHPDGKPAQYSTAILNWSIGDSTRIKGYLYGISKDEIKQPEKFTTDSAIKFENLSDGRYFFSLRSVDKTNALSRINMYQVIVGSAKALDPEVYRKMAQGAMGEEGFTLKQAKPKVPSVDLQIPFDIAEPFSKSSFDAEIKALNIKKTEIIGYSYSFGREKKLPPDRVNLRANTINVSDLKNGEYFISAKIRYFRQQNNIKEFLWTEPVIKKFTVSIPVGESPLLAYIRQIIKRIAGGSVAVSLSLVAMALSIITIGLGAKIAFYLKLIQYKLTNVFRMFM